MLNVKYILELPSVVLLHRHSKNPLWNYFYCLIFNPLDSLSGFGSRWLSGSVFHITSADPQNHGCKMQKTCDEDNMFLNVLKICINWDFSSNNQRSGIQQIFMQIWMLEVAIICTMHCTERKLNKNFIIIPENMGC